MTKTTHIPRDESVTPPPRETTGPVPDSVTNQGRLSAVLAIVLALLIVGMASYGYYRVTAMLDPENLGDRVEAAIEEHYPEFRAKLVTEIEGQAPEIAEQVSSEMLASMPDARKELEDLTARQIDLAIDEGTELSAEQFRQMLRDNREPIVKVFETIEDAPEDAHQLVLSMEGDLEKSINIDVQRQARNVLRAHRGLNQKLEKLSSPDAQLEPNELLERRIVRILRAMQVAQKQNMQTVGD